jgi:hypothetical protein
VHEECVTKFQELKLGKKCKYIIYKLNKENTQIVIEKVSQGGDYEDFLEDLPAYECRWGVFDLEYRKETAEGEPIVKYNKLMFVHWCVLNHIFFEFCFNEKTSLLRVSSCLQWLAFAGVPTLQRSKTKWCSPLPKKHLGALLLASL